MAKRIAEFSLECYNDEKDFTYSCPPKKDDYLAIFPEPLYHQFMRYINGNLNDIFLSNVLENWGVDTKNYEPVVKLGGDYGGGRTGVKMGIDLTNAVRPLLRSWKARFLNLREMRGINIQFLWVNNSMTTYAIRTHGIHYASKADEKVVNEYFPMPDTNGILHSLVLVEEDTFSFDIAVPEALALAACGQIGEKHFTKLLAEAREVLKTYVVPPPNDMELFTSNPQEGEQAVHIHTNFEDEDVDDFCEGIESGRPPCNTPSMPSCDCLQCTSLNAYRDDNCCGCSSTSCSLWGMANDYEDDNDEGEDI
jgi:hypothetical protein